MGFLLIEYSGNVSREKTTVPDLLKNIFLKPPILGVIFAICMLLLDLSLPGPLMSFAGYVSDSVTPLALIYCGFIVYEVGLGNLRLMRGLPTMVLMRLGLAPLVCLLFCTLFGVEGLPLEVFVVASALPVPSQVTVMAGAFGAGVVAFLDGSLKSGIETVLDTVGFDRLLEGTDYVFTGEGRIDSQSLRGKVISGVAARAVKQGVPVIALVGDVLDDAYGAYDIGVTAIFSINRLAIPFSEARHRSDQDYVRTFDDVLRLIRAAESGK